MLHPQECCLIHIESCVTKQNCYRRNPTFYYTYLALFFTRWHPCISKKTSPSSYRTSGGLLMRIDSSEPIAGTEE